MEWRWAGILVSCYFSFACSADEPRRQAERMGEQQQLACTVGAVQASPASAVPLDGTVHLTATGSCTSGTPEYRFAWQLPGTPTTTGVIREWGPSNQADWDTTGFSGNFNLYAYTRTAGSNLGPEGSKILGPYLVGRVCNSTSLSVSPPAAVGSSVPLGTPISLSATAACTHGGAAEYQFYYIPPGPTATYVQVLAPGQAAGSWGPATATLETTPPLVAGKYSMQVRARAIGNASVQESNAYGPARYFIGDVCPSVSLTAAPISPQPRGQVVTLTGSATCTGAATPQYQFRYKLASASTYQDIGAWGDSVRTWNTSALVPGDYHLQVFSRAAGNQSNLEGNAVIPFTVSPSLVLAVNGEAQTSIYYAPGNDTAQREAGELARVLNEMTGGSFLEQPIPTPLPAHGVFLATAAGGGLPAGVSPPSGSDATYREAFTIKAVGSQLWLAGNEDLALRHAVARLLETFGYRWFFQSPAWRVVPSSPTLIYDGQTISDKPHMLHRLLTPSSFGDDSNAFGRNQTNDQNGWRKHNGLAYNQRVGSSWVYNNTARPLTFNQGAFGNDVQAAPCPYNFICQVNLGALSSDPRFPAGYFSSNPSRYGQTAASDHTTVEVTNPDLPDAFTRWLFDLMPTRNAYPNVFSLEPSDGTHAISRSAAAMALGNDADQLVYLGNQVLSAAGGPSSPQRLITLLAGYYHALPPLNQPLSEDFFVAVMPLRIHAVGAHRTTASLLAAWRQAGARVGYYDTYSYKDRGRHGAGYNRSPLTSDFLNDSVALPREYREMADAGMTAINIGAQDNFGRSGLGYYLTAKLAWNPYVDTAAVRADFFARAFPSAADAMRSYFDVFDPKGSSIVVTRDMIAKALAFLDDAGSAAEAAGSTAEVARINELKAFEHHRTLWWQLLRAPECTACTINDAQPQLAMELLRWDYRNRYSYMTDYRTDRIMASNAAIQFGLPDFEDEQNWTADPTVPSPAEIAQKFASDRAILSPDPATELAFDDELVLVSDFAPAKASQFSGAGSPLKVALYTTNDSVSFNVITYGTLPADFPPAQMPPVRVRLAQQNGETLLDTSGNPLELSFSPEPTVATVPLTFSNIQRPPGKPPGARYAVFLHIDAGGQKVEAQANASNPLVLVLDKVVRSLSVSIRGGVNNGAYFYVPGNTTHIEYVWSSSLPTSAAKPVAVTIPPHGLVDPAGVVHSITTGPQEVVRHPVPVQHRNKLWRIIGLNANQLWFFNIPPYLTESPSSMMVPRGVAEANDLHIVE